MRIGLIGAPGSGKTALAEALCVRQGNTHMMGMIDDYPQRAVEEIDHVPGFDAGYVGNLVIALYRYGEERTALEGWEHVITCGTLLETSVYAAMEFEAVQAVHNEVEREDDLRRVEATLKTLACLFADSWRYDACFYLPSASDDPRWQMFDKHLQAAFSAFGLVENIVVLDNPDLETRIQTALNEISEYESNTQRDEPEPAQTD